MTATPGGLVVMLHDGARRFLAQAAAAQRAGETVTATAKLRRAEAIVSELLTTLDLEEGGDVASHLQGLYVFFLRTLNEARLEGDPDKLDWVSEQLGELRDAWSQVAGASG